MTPQPPSAAEQTATPTFAISSQATPTLEKPIPASCTPLPQATGEKIIAPTVEATPQTQLSAGQVLTLTYSGGYIILNNAIMCDDEFVGYVYSDELYGTPNWDRQVSVRLDNEILERVECGYTCQIEVMMPEDLSSGIHTLTLPFRISFDVEILADG